MTQLFSMALAPRSSSKAAATSSAKPWSARTPPTKRRSSLSAWLNSLVAWPSSRWAVPMRSKLVRRKTVSTTPSMLRELLLKRVSSQVVDLLSCTHLLCLRMLSSLTRNKKTGKGIVQRAIQIPAKSIIKNAGENAEVIVGKLLEEADGSMITKGRNSATAEYVDMIEAGVIDPTKVVRTALLDASSVTSLMMTAEAIITEIPEEKPAAPPMPGGGGMGGMPGMF
mmetsp:Transcript_3175/g.6228  ORF Transcript_3175/g.6228 Transcript_3175/m.6228 type:complete len:225 (-) Transcript_3175:171-845(-)